MTRYTLTQAITLGKRAAREDDALYIFYTKLHGKISAYARGVKKIKSKLSGHLEPFGLIDLGIVHGAHNNRVAHAVGVYRFMNIQKDFDTIFFGSFGLRLVNKIFQENAPDEKVFQLLTEYLEILDDKNLSKHFSFLNPAFTFKILSFLGYNPEIEKCVRCGKRISGDSYFSALRGGTTCLACEKEKDGFNLSENERFAIRNALSSSLKEFLAQTDNAMMIKFHTLASHFLIAHIGIN